MLLVYLLHHVAADGENTITTTEAPLQLIARRSNDFTLKMYNVSMYVNVTVVKAMQCQH